MDEVDLVGYIPKRDFNQFLGTAVLKKVKSDLDLHLKWTWHSAWWQSTREDRNMALPSPSLSLNYSVVGWRVAAHLRKKQGSLPLDLRHILWYFTTLPLILTLHLLLALPTWLKG